MWFFLIYCFMGAQIGAAQRGATPVLPVIISTCALSVASSIYGPVSWWLGLLSLGAALLLYTAIRRELKSRCFGFIGKVSYSWYLIHPVFGYSIGWSAVSYLHLPDQVGLTIGAGCMLAMSAACYKFIEQPGMQLANRLIGRTKNRA